MKVVIPMAGKGTRLRPHTHTKAKPMIHVAGKPVLGHILDKIKTLDPEEVIFVTGGFAKETEAYIKENYTFKTQFIPQKEMKGTAHAVHLAKEFVKEDMLILFVDTIFEADLSIIKTTDADGLIWAEKTDDPQRFGILVTTEDQTITNMVEKPQEFVGDLAIIGMYYIKNSQLLFKCNEELFEKNIQSKGEFWLTDTLRLMMEQGQVFKAATVEKWLDCGVPKTVLETNQYLLKKFAEQRSTPKNSVICEPVFIEKEVEIENCIIGPNVSIARGAVIKHSIIENSIVNENAKITGAKLKDSLVGEHAVVQDVTKQLNVGDHSEIVLGPSPDTTK